ncbi:MAG: GLUG motif-containing protein [Planctomycetota bacterium]|jgi:probable HAF family extracellular repeat protein
MKTASNSRVLRAVFLIVLVWILHGGVPICTQAAIVYEVIDLGTLGGPGSAALSINDPGQIIGEADERATLFDQTGAGNNINLGTLGGDGSSAYSINNAGQIVGYANNSQGGWRATLFDPTGAGSNIDLGTLGGNDSFAWSINKASQIVGLAGDRATLFDSTGAGNNIDLGTLGGDSSQAWSINDAGQIVGSADGHATLFDPTGAGNNIDLNTLGGDLSKASSINEAGQIVGWARNSQGSSRATLFDPTGAGNNIDLGTLGGGESEAYSINDAAQIVGQAENSQGQWRAVLFDLTGAGNNIDLNTLINPASDWTLINAHDINASGWIVGKGSNSRGKGQAFLLVPQPAKYSGGTGEPDDPYQIATAEDLMLLGETPEDYDKHFILTADIDLDPNLPGRKVFDRAVIAPDVHDDKWRFHGTAFTGVFDGIGHTISHLTIEGSGYLGLFGQTGSGASISNLGLEDVDINGTGNVVSGLAGDNGGSITLCYSTGTIKGNGIVGGLVGWNGRDIIAGNIGGTIIACSSTGTVCGDSRVGGLVGGNVGSIVASYSTATVSGDSRVGGLAGYNYGVGGSIATSYSTGTVSGDEDVGGLVAIGDYEGIVFNCFWNIQTSGQLTSAGGTGLTTDEMHDINTYLDAGWDFVDEILNGTCDYWQISPGDYPRLHYHDGESSLIPEGLGTAEQPYLIQDANDLGTVWYKPLAHYRLEESLDLSGITWHIAVVPWFKGTFEGNNHVISNLHIKGGGSLGLFGQLGSGASISNLGLEDVDVNGTGRYAGGLAGDNEGNIAASYNTGMVSGDEDVGGLVGRNLSSITMSHSSGTVTGDSDVGGLVGENRGSITASFSSSTVSGDWEIGGVVGGNYGNITASYSMSTVTGDWPVGGLIGQNG